MKAALSGMYNDASPTPPKKHKPAFGAARAGAGLDELVMPGPPRRAGGARGTPPAYQQP